MTRKEPMTKTKAKAEKQEKRAKKAQKSNYFRDSWREIRQVRWPNRKATWKMVLAVIIYTAIFIVALTLIDALFSLIFNNLLG